MLQDGSTKGGNTQQNDIFNVVLNFKKRQTSLAAPCFKNHKKHQINNILFFLYFYLRLIKTFKTFLVFLTLFFETLMGSKQQ